MADAAVPALDRLVLEGVPRVCFYEVGMRCPEDVPFPSCLRASLEFLGERLGCRHLPSPGATGPSCTYAYLMATSGAAFRLLWDPAWGEATNGDLLRMAPDPLEPICRAFASVGYEFELLLRDDYARRLGLEGAAGEAEFRHGIVESLRAGRPAIALGVVGPPECCLVTGFDEGGDVLIGWSFFQDRPECSAGLESEECGYFRKRGWAADTLGLILLGERSERPSWEDAVRAALEWAVQIARTPEVHGRHGGLAAYLAWSQALLRDEEFRAGDVAALGRRFAAHNEAVGALAEGRWYAAQFLKEAARREPGRSAGLLAAAACCETEHDLMWQVWNLQGGIGTSEEKVLQFADPEVRRRMVPVILEARRKCEEAVGHLERVLSSPG